MKISVITVCYNAGSTIERCIRSVLAQDFDQLEYIIIDGGSTDNTIDVTKLYQSRISLCISAPDKGIYDAMNKGIALATGDVIGMLNADDHFADDMVLSDVAKAFERSRADIVYADLNYLNPAGKIIRKWRTGNYKQGLFNYGWMPPHPTFYCKRELFEKFGSYSLKFGTAADYELMLRFIHLNRAPVYYLQRVTVQMSTGGASNRNVKARVRSLYFDLRAMYENSIFLPFIVLIIKPLRKLKQFF